MEHFNQLTPAEAERLANLAEECAEAIKVVGKILRHGYESVDPTGKEPGTNRQQLQVELGDISGVVAFMFSKDDIEPGAVDSSKYAKLNKLKQGKYQHHQ